jgi:secondary thiamine-phosphate synthase enzyme
MTVYSKSFRIQTKADGGMADVTEYVAGIVAASEVKDGIAVVFCPGSTGAVSTVEFEPGLQKDIPEALERIAPAGIPYEHHKTWGCDNGRSHVRATLIGPSLTVPVKNKQLVLGTWQQIVFIKLDTREIGRASCRERV